MTSRGLEMPPDQKASHTRSTLLFNSPVITVYAPNLRWYGTERNPIQPMTDIGGCRQLNAATVAPGAIARHGEFLPKFDWPMAVRAE